MKRKQTFVVYLVEKTGKRVPQYKINCVDPEKTKRYKETYNTFNKDEKYNGVGFSSDRQDLSWMFKDSLQDLKTYFH